MQIVEDKKEIQNNKSLYVNQMFTSIAGKYDLLNDLISFGLHKKWKKLAAKLALKESKKPKFVLDICSGTGDLGILFSNECQDTEILCTDNCKEMLSILEDKIKKLNIKNIKTKIEDAENLSFTDSSFDIITVGYGIRNLENREKALKKIFSLLNSDGVFACIDLGHPENLLWKKIFFFFFYKVVPCLGNLFAKNKEAYTYLPESLKTWYTQEEFKNMLLKIGFKKCYYKNLFGGVSAIHVAVK